MTVYIKSAISRVVNIFIEIHEIERYCYLILTIKVQFNQ